MPSHRRKDVEMGKSAALKEAVVNHKASVGMVLVGIIAAGILAKNKRRR